jgi:predicted RNA-binding protein associated with RNAse of E/G family
MSDEAEKIIAALEKGQATPEQQKEAARIIRDLDKELREISEWEQRD